jgi:hypothetical protein
MDDPTVSRKQIFESACLPKDSVLRPGLSSVAHLERLLLAMGHTNFHSIATKASRVWHYAVSQPGTVRPSGCVIVMLDSGPIDLLPQYTLIGCKVASLDRQQEAFANKRGVFRWLDLVKKDVNNLCRRSAYIASFSSPV